MPSIALPFALFVHPTMLRALPATLSYYVARFRGSTVSGASLAPVTRRGHVMCVSTDAWVRFVCFPLLLGGFRCCLVVLAAVFWRSSFPGPFTSPPAFLLHRWMSSSSTSSVSPPTTCSSLVFVPGVFSAGRAFSSQAFGVQPCPGLWAPRCMGHGLSPRPPHGAGLGQLPFRTLCPFSRWFPAFAWFVALSFTPRCFWLCYLSSLTSLLRCTSVSCRAYFLPLWLLSVPACPGSLFLVSCLCGWHFLVPCRMRATFPISSRFCVRRAAP